MYDGLPVIDADAHKVGPAPGGRGPSAGGDGLTSPAGSVRTLAVETRLEPGDCTLFSGAANGSEAAFGEAAERHGVEEVNFTFEGHNDARHRGIRVLTQAELRHGDVSLSYVSKLMHRKYPDTPLFRKVLQSIWHQVNNGQEIYVVGKVLPDDTVMGGTGVAAEYAKFFNKPLFVFDQERDGWSRWSGEQWEPVRDPVIAHPHFTGTGTRFLRDNGRAAIAALFARTFG